MVTPKIIQWIHKCPPLFDSVLNDLESCVNNFDEIVSCVTSMLCIWGDYPAISTTYLSPDHQVLLLIYHHNVHLAANPRTLSKKNSYFVYTMSMQIDVALADVLIAKIVAYMKKIWKVIPRCGQVPFKGPFVLGSLIYLMLKQ